MSHIPYFSEIESLNTDKSEYDALKRFVISLSREPLELSIDKAMEQQRDWKRRALKLKAELYPNEG